MASFRVMVTYLETYLISFLEFLSGQELEWKFHLCVCWCLRRQDIGLRCPTENKTDLFPSLLLTFEFCKNKIILDKPIVKVIFTFL